MNRSYANVVGIAAGAVMLIVTTSLASADGGYGWSRGHAFRAPGHGMQMHGKAGHRLADRLLRHPQLLGLTDDQTAKLKALTLERDVAAIKAHAAVMLAARELRALVSDEKSELSAIEAKVNEQQQLEGKLQMIGIKARRDTYAVLTAEQRDKLKALREQMRHGYRSHMMKTDARPADHEGHLPAAEAASPDSRDHEEANQAG
jgi:Spy/CpxP family protein refolding chaperone